MTRADSDGQTMTPFEPPRLQDGSATPRRHTLAKAVRLGPLAGIGLVGSLHVFIPFATEPRDKAQLREGSAAELSARPGLAVVECLSF